MVPSVLLAAAFAFVTPERCGRVFVANAEPEFVALAAYDLVADVERITGRRPMLVRGETAKPGDVLIVTRPDGRREASDATVDGGVLRLTGSDHHGTMAGIYSFIENRLGVDPLSFWNGVPHPKRSTLSWENVDLHEPSPVFRFRGAFINDEDFLLHWRPTEGSRPVLTSRVVGGRIMNHGTMAKIAETLVRMRFNMVIPGSYLDPTDPVDARNLEVCAKRGLYLSQHHHDPLGQSGFMFLNSAEARSRKLNYSYTENPKEIEAGWRRSAKAYARFPNVVWQIGLRGVTDAPAWKDDPSAPRDDASRAEMIARAMRKQVSILDEIGVPRKNRHVTATLWGEGSYFMSKDLLKTPEGTILVFSDNSSGWWWPDDFHSFRPRQSVSTGIYYHLNLLTAGPHHVPGISASRHAVRLREAIAKGMTDYVVVNVGNIREYVYNLDALRRMLISPDSFDTETWERKWCAARFPVRTDEAHAAITRYFAAPALHPVHGHPMFLDGHVYYNLWGHCMFDILDRTLAALKSGQPFPPPVKTGDWHSRHKDPFAVALFDSNLPALGPWADVLKHVERQRNEYAKLLPLARDLEAAQPDEFRYRAFTSLTYPVELMHSFSVYAAGLVRAAQACERRDRTGLEKALAEALAGFNGYEDLAARYQRGQWEGWLRRAQTIDIRDMINWTRHFLKLARDESYADDGEFSFYRASDADDVRFAPDSLVVHFRTSRPVKRLRVLRTDGGEPLLDARLKSPTTACTREVAGAAGLPCLLMIDFADGGTRKILSDTADALKIPSPRSP